MRKTGMRVGLLALGLSALLASFAPSAKAQGEGDKTTTVTIVPIKNVRAKMMAFWLTPRKTPIPDSQAQGIKSLLEFGIENDIGIDGLESITADAVKNELIVEGTPESVRKLKEIVEFLDRPGKQVAIKAWFVEVDAERMADLGIRTFVESKRLKNEGESVLGSNTVVFNNNTFRSKIQPLIQSQNAKILQFAQVATWNNSTAKVSWNDNGVTSQMDLEATPTIQNDDTVTIYLTPKMVSNKISGDLISSQYVSTVANVKADDVIVVSMLNMKGSKRVTLILVSAKIINDQTDLLD